ncbi:hypothetical protein [Ferrimicrobium acidiphilum]|uniref:hypothetical protein n=1 Tax=Ferrimicrobium acidiphilum TaxID=121039 RepID=UPI0023F1222A|nr:hypothetical protein [Ferrimicrobium acidiphilum]
MQIQVRTEGVTYVVARGPAPVMDRDSGNEKVDSDGVVLHMLQLVAMSPDGAEVLQVRVSGKPAGLVTGQPVKVTNLVAIPWAIGDKNGVSFRADSVAPVVARS